MQLMHVDGFILLSLAAILAAITYRDHGRMPLPVRAVLVLAAFFAFSLGVKYLSIGLHVIGHLYWARIGLDVSLATLAAVRAWMPWAAPDTRTPPWIII